MDELIDIIDENNNVLYQVMKSKAHKDGLLHQAIWALIYEKSSKKVLIAKRAPQKLMFPNLWGWSFAGHVGAGETPMETAIREAKEEINFDVEENNCIELFHLKGICENERDKDVEMVYVYLICVDEIDFDKIKLQESEVSEIKMVSIDELIDLHHKGEGTPIEEKYLENLKIEAKKMGLY